MCIGVMDLPGAHIICGHDPKQMEFVIKKKYEELNLPKKCDYYFEQVVLNQ